MSTLPPRRPKRDSTKALLEEDTRDLDRLVEQVEEALSRSAAETAYRLRRCYNTQGTIEIDITKLSHLHAQLNSMTTQCTLLVGFALAGLGADMLSELGTEVGEFCIYKTLPARILGSVYIATITLCIFFSITVIACAQTIACESKRVITVSNRGPTRA